MKHFKLTTESIVNSFGAKLFRIELTIDCKWGKIGDKGGFIEKEENISGNAWVSGDAQVYGNAQVSGDAQVYGDAWEQSPIQIKGTKHFVNECKKGYLKIGCTEHTFKYWKDNFEAIGKKENYSDKQIKEYGLYIDLAINLSKL